MKKTIITVFAFLVIFGFTISGAFAQTWKWQYAEVIYPTTEITQLTANPTATPDQLYALSDGSIATVVLGDAVTGTTFFDPPGALTTLTDITYGYLGAIYAIADSAVASCTPAACAPLNVQPYVPTTNGTFKHIAAGNNGKLFVLYDDGTQYILTGNPPITEGLTVKLNPQSLNLGSKGKWVTCQVQLPEGNNIADLDTSSIEITQFQVGEDVYDVSIPVYDNAPVGTATDKRIVKFIRYDKTDSSNPASMVGALSSILTEQSKGKIDVTATVQASLFNGETFSGEVTFQVIVPKAIKQK